MAEKILMMCGTSIFEKYAWSLLQNGITEETIKNYQKYQKEFNNDSNKQDNFLSGKNTKTEIQNSIKYGDEIISFHYNNTLTHYEHVITNINSFDLMHEQKKNFNEAVSAEIAFFVDHLLESRDQDLTFVFIVTDSLKGRLSFVINAEIYNQIAKHFNDKTIKIECQIIDGLQLDDTKKLDEIGLMKLFEFVGNEIKTAKEQEQLITINITGGYKCIMPYLYIYGCFEDNVKISYLYENADRNKELLKLPLSFDLAGIMDYQKIIDSHKEVSDEIYNSFPEYIKVLYTEDKPHKLNYVGNIINSRLKKFRSINSSFYGYGTILLDFFKDKKIKSRVEKRIFEWEHIWLGDLIPETVEHARGHCQRLMTFAYQMLHTEKIKGSNDFINDTELEILIYCLWLHDIGHSAFKLEDSCVEISKFPSLIRDLHNVLSYEKILSLNFDTQEIQNCVAEICLHHRFRMPMEESHVEKCIGAMENKKCPADCDSCQYTQLRKNKEDSYKSGCDAFFQTILADCIHGSKYPRTKLLEKEVTINDTKVRKRYLGALLRLFDCLDVQKERTINESYSEYRQNQTKLQYTYVLKQLKQYITPVIEYADEKITGTYNDITYDFFYFIKFVGYFISKINFEADLNIKEQEIRLNFSDDEITDKMLKSNFSKFLTQNFINAEINGGIIKFSRTDTDNTGKNKKICYNDILDALSQSFYKIIKLLSDIQETENISIDKYFKNYLINFLSCIDQYRFKKEQQEHFKKHASINYVYFRSIPATTDKFSTFELIIDSDDPDHKKKLFQDIKIEYLKIENILNDEKIKLIFND